jgi:hypothetical protein
MVISATSSGTWGRIAKSEGLTPLTLLRGRAIQAEVETLRTVAAQTDPLLRAVRIRENIGGLIPDFVFNQGGRELIIDITSPRQPSIMKAAKYARTGEEIIAEIYHMGRGLK